MMMMIHSNNRTELHKRIENSTSQNRIHCNRQLLYDFSTGRSNGVRPVSSYVKMMRDNAGDFDRWSEKTWG